MKCARCGLERGEHHYNGGAYGVCGEFVMTDTPPIVARLRDWHREGEVITGDVALYLEAAEAIEALLGVVEDFRQKLATYVSVYPGDKELKRQLHDCDTAIAKVRGQS
jgi:hypothetical protein